MKHIISHKKYNGHRVYRDVYYDPLNPLDLPPYTVRIKCTPNTYPYYSRTTGVFKTADQVSTSPNVWDITYNSSNWNYLFDAWLWASGPSNIIEVMGANSTNVTSMDGMFRKCSKLSSVPLYDTSNVTSMAGMFEECSKISSVPLYDTSNVTRMGSMHKLCTSLTSVPLYDTHNVTNMDGMFGHCSKLSSVPLYDTHNVTNMQSMFSNCSELSSVPLYDTHNVTKTVFMFDGCTKLSSVPLFDTSNVTNMQSMFINCSALTSIPQFNVSKATSMYYTFYNCINVQTGALELYQKAITTQYVQSRNHSATFRNCGINTQTGSAELAQIPSSWK